MKIEDFENVKEHINILNVAYHLNIEITNKFGNEVRAICPFCGYRDYKRNADLKLNYINNTYHCFNCGKSGYSIGLYAKIRGIDNKSAFKELMQREFFSIDSDRSKFDEIPLNQLADINYRNMVYTDFLKMLKLEIKHKKYLEKLGFEDDDINKCNFKSIPKKKIDRQIICGNLRYKYNLEGIPGFFMNEDFTWDFSGPYGFFIPVYDEIGRIQGLSIHLDKSINNCKDLWFSSNGKINGTQARNWITSNNVAKNTKTIILTDNLLTYNLIKQIDDTPIISFSTLNNSYSIIEELEKTDVENIIFTIRRSKEKQKLDYLIEKVFGDLFELGYNVSFKFLDNYKDVLKEDFCKPYILKVA